MKKIGKNSLSFDNVNITNGSTVVGPKEYEGPLGKYFDKHYNDLWIDDSKTWEKAEMRLYEDALKILLVKSNLNQENIDCVISGDLNNQIIISNYVMRNYNIPFLGVFGACSTSVESIIIGANFIEAIESKERVVNIIAGTSSHNSTAERQFRYPTEYGGQRPSTITSTVTAAGLTLLSSLESGIKITKATLGRVIDANMKDSLDMGRVMAPAAYDTIKQHFADFNIDNNYYDLIITGDLSYYGTDMLIKLFKNDGINISSNLDDAGLMIYRRNTQNVFAGGSGCGCCAAILNSYLLEKLKDKTYKRILVVATGALHNPILLSQKESIPAIAHAIAIERI